MKEIKSLQLQLERKVLILSHRIHDIFASLEHLNTITDILFTMTPGDPQAVSDWVQQRGFQADDQGYVTSAQEDALTYQWPARSFHSESLARRYYALRNIGSVLNDISAKLDEVTFIYYQDLEHSASLAYPYRDIRSMIPADFNWLEYFSYLSVNADVNPQREIRWSPPNIDYGGEGLISIASIPYYQDERLIGIWSIDVPLHAIHKNCVLDTIFPEQINFIVDYNGRIITHPSVETEIDKEKGSFCQLTLEQLQGGFDELDLAGLIAQQKGVLHFADDQGNRQICIYQIVPGINWIIFATLPEDVVFENVRAKIAKAFNTINHQPLPDVIDFDVGDEMRLLVDSYNDMVKVLAFNQKKREQAQQQAFEAQRVLNEELEKQVAERTEELQRLNSELAKQAQTDSLTGILNRRHFMYLSDEVLKIQRRNTKASSLLMMDIDDFKAINDEYGHDIGDEVIVSLSECVSSSLRDSDLFARFGGEEFVILLPETRLHGALTLAEKIRKSIEQLQTSSGVTFTLSIGVSELFSDVEDAISRADKALYLAKSEGKNQVAPYVG